MFGGIFGDGFGSDDENNNNEQQHCLIENNNINRNEQTPCQRYKIILQYDGTYYSGWQRQSRYNHKQLQLGGQCLTEEQQKQQKRVQTNNTVQQVLENVITRYVESMVGSVQSTTSNCSASSPLDVVSQQIQVFGSSRTDAGVHAIRTTAHFDLMRHHVRNGFPDESVLLKSLNHYLTEERVRVTSVHKVSQDYNARYAARKRIYCYKIVLVPDSHLNVRFPLLDHRVWYFNVGDFIRRNVSKENRGNLFDNASFDVQRVYQAAQALTGTHDFAAFCSPSGDVQRRDINTVRTVESIDVQYHSPQQHSSSPDAFSMFLNPQFDSVTITITGPSFLYHQCRFMIHVLMCVATGILSVDDIQMLFEQKQMPRGERRMAPPYGLYLVDVIE